MVNSFPASKSWTKPSKFPAPSSPASGGSSVGTSILREGTHDDLRRAVARALTDGSGALIEELIGGTEITCAVMGEGENARALPLIEIVPQKGGGILRF